MIRDVVVHMNGEQPMMADLYGMPSPSDVTLVCTNLRMMNGQRPVFIDAIDSVFVFPLVHVRFVEVPARATGALAVVAGPDAGAGIGDGSPGPASAGASSPGSEGSGEPEADTPADEPEPDLEIDEDFLRRVREI